MTTISLFGFSAAREVSTFGTNRAQNMDNISEQKLKKLYMAVGEYLNDTLVEFNTQGKVNRTTMLDVFNRDTLNLIAMQILNNRSDTFETRYYEKTRILIATLLELFQNALQQHREILDLESRNADCEERAGILDDMTLLKEYIAELSKRMQIFPTQELSMTVAPAIKPEYLEYIKRYGMPENAIFDSQKLSEIQLELGINI
jgi:hypothetical protein